MQPFLNIIVPAYNEGINVEEFCKQTTAVVNELNISYEIIFVNDGSRDDTLLYMLNMVEKYDNVRVIDFSRNFGQIAAISAGMNMVNSEIAIIMDCDLQHNPKYIQEMIQYYHEGYDMVVPLNKERNDQSPLKKFLSKSFYKVFRFITGVQLPSGASDFRLISRKMLNVLNSLPEKNRFLKALYQWPGYNIKYFDYSVDQRFSGESKWNFYKLWSYSLDAVFSFSANLLKVWFYIGVLITAIAFLYLGNIIFQKVFLGVGVPGFPTIACLILLLNGFVILQSSIMGEYIARIYDEVKGRPLYIIRHEYNKDNIHLDNRENNATHTNNSDNQ